MALTTLKSLDAEIKQLEARKKLVEKRDGEVPQALAVLQKYSKVLTPAQRRQIAKIVGGVGEAAVTSPARAAKPATSSAKGRSLGKVAPKYRLPTGETWTGRGLEPKVFVAWHQSAEGKAWRAANQGEKFPPADSTKPSAKAGKVALKKASKVVAKSVKAPAKKGAKKGAKKIARKPVRKAKKG
ncbi:TPA: H-NS histone family protein [Stenotrophomonas maltophilia]|nr:H-NS histone family protein [Stenotrophomonas maltophilia]